MYWQLVTMQAIYMQKDFAHFYWSYADFNE